MDEKLVFLQSSWRYYKTSEGFIISSILYNSRFLIKGEKLNSIEALLFEIANGVPESNLVNHLSEQSNLSYNSVKEMIDMLENKNALVRLKKELINDENELYDRQVRFFNYFENQTTTGTDYNNNLQNRKVLVVGLGGYGSWLILLLARMGIKNIVGIDPDIVELSNLNRQVLYSRKDIGSLKVDACRRYLTNIDENIVFEGYPIKINSTSDLYKFLSDVDIVLNPLGYIPFDSKYPKDPHFIAQAAINAGVPALTFSGSWMGPLTIPGKTPCYGCVISDKEISDTIEASLPQPGTRFLPAFAPRIVNTTSLVAWETARFLSGINESPLLKGIIALDTFNYTKHSIINIKIDDRCPFCMKARKSLI